MAGSLLVLQGGGPTAVINTSLYGVLDEARQQGKYTKLIGAKSGIAGLLKGDLIDLTNVPQEELERLKVTPGAALGSTRVKPAEADVERIIARLRENDVRALLLIGGNGSLRGAQFISDAARRVGYDVSVIGVPKTIDNDIPITDRCPGYGSAARYLAQSVRDLGMDVRALPQPISIYETMGRSVGWLAGAAVLAKLDEEHAPHLIYLPERAFEVQRFLGDVDRVVKRLGWCVVVVNEGIKDAAGRLVYEVDDASQQDDLNRALPGGVAAHLASVVTKNLKIRCRWEQPGLCGRSSILHVSRQDWVDAEMVGRVGVRAAIEGKSAVMVALRPLRGDAVISECDLVPIEQAAGKEKLVPSEWITEGGVTENFVNYVKPIVGRLLAYATPLTRSTHQ
jgi:ATP-dependent phosphofructokinase / diphosphate-dependent phosphofructokinase